MKYAKIAPGVMIPDHAEVKGRANIRTPADVLVLGPSATDGKTYTTAHCDDDLGVRVTRGCFSGSLDEFIAMIVPYSKGRAAMTDQADEFVAAIRAHFNLD